MTRSSTAKASLIGKMPGDRWQRFANLRAYFGFMWGHPGKKLLFMGGEFAPGTGVESRPRARLALARRSRCTPVCSALVRDLNRLYVSEPALHERDCEADGFQWTVGDDRCQFGVFASCAMPPISRRSLWSAT